MNEQVTPLGELEQTNHLGESMVTKARAGGPVLAPGPCSLRDICARQYRSPATIDVYKRQSQVHKDLERLTGAGLILREPRGNLVFYRANPDAAVYPELVGLVGKSFGIADRLRACLEPVASRIQCAIVFGSVARREQRADSDVDLLLIGEVRLSELAVPLHAAEEALCMRISPTLMSVEEFRRKRQNDDYFLKNVLAGELITLWGALDPTVAP